MGIILESGSSIEKVKTRVDEKLLSPKAPGKVHLSIPGQAYLLTAATMFRRPVFRNVEAARIVSSTHEMKWVWRDSQWLAWVLTPTHWHCLVVLGKDDELKNLIGRFKRASSEKVDERFKINGWLWAKGFRDRSLNREVVLRDAAMHLVAIPVRAGLVEDVGKYPYWNAAWLDSENLHAGSFF